MITTILTVTNIATFILTFYFMFRARNLEKKIEEFQEELEKQNVTVDFLHKIVGQKKKKNKLSDSSGFFNLFEK
jgi:hypothetical protein